MSDSNGGSRLPRDELLSKAWAAGHPAPQRLSTTRLARWLDVRGISTRRYS